MAPRLGEMTSRRQYHFRLHDPSPLLAIPSTHQAILFHNEAGGSRRACRHQRCLECARLWPTAPRPAVARGGSDMWRGTLLGAERRKWYLWRCLEIGGNDTAWHLGDSPMGLGPQLRAAPKRWARNEADPAPASTSGTCPRETQGARGGWARDFSKSTVLITNSY